MKERKTHQCVENGWFKIGANFNSVKAFKNHSKREKQIFKRGCRTNGDSVSSPYHK